jgi:pyruvate formate lyase activating enzyme
MSRTPRKSGSVRCASCGSGTRPVAAVLGVCAECIRRDSPQVRDRVRRARARTRRPFGLPRRVPSDRGGRLCNLCVNECRVPDGGVGYCGLPVGRRATAKVQWYYDPLPTNCVADWVCPGGTGCGYPEYAYSHGPERGYKNLAVFYEACVFDCLFCQNWHYREYLGREGQVTPKRLADAVDEGTACICYFGGDPTPQLPHAIRASRLAREQAGDRILRICWETNGSMHPRLLDRMCDLSLESGGCLKFDLKAWSEPLHIALCGATNRRTLGNFRRAAARMRSRPVPPPLVASTLLVPGYVDASEVSQIAGLIASLDPEIPYSLLAFHPAYHMQDLPTTSKRHADECRAAALDAGLARVRIGNIHLLGTAY